MRPKVFKCMNGALLFYYQKHIITLLNPFVVTSDDACCSSECAFSRRTNLAMSLWSSCLCCWSSAAMACCACCCIPCTKCCMCWKASIWRDTQQIPATLSTRNHPEPSRIMWFVIGNTLEPFTNTTICHLIKKICLTLQLLIWLWSWNLIR